LILGFGWWLLWKDNTATIANANKEGPHGPEKGEATLWYYFASLSVLFFSILESLTIDQSTSPTTHDTTLYYTLLLYRECLKGTPLCNDLSHPILW
jgi:hypothetical protein